MEDPMQEEATHGLSEEEKAKHAYYSFRWWRLKVENGWADILQVILKLHAQSFQDVQSSSDHVHEAEQRELCMGQKRLRRLKSIQRQQQKW